MSGDYGGCWAEPSQAYKAPCLPSFKAEERGQRQHQRYEWLMDEGIYMSEGPPPHTNVTQMEVVRTW